MLILISFFAVFALLIVLYKQIYSHRNKLLSKIPSPKKDFYLHNSLAFYKKSLEEIFNQYDSWHKELGDVFHLTLNPFEPAIIHIADPVLAKAVSLHQPDRYNAMSYTPLRKWIGNRGFYLTSADLAKTRFKPLMKIQSPKFIQKVCLFLLVLSMVLSAFRC